MQGIKDFWNKNKTSKIIVIVGGLIIFCCTCSILISLLPKSDNLTPAPALDVDAIYTQAAKTALAEFLPEETTADPLPTAEPEATNTPEPTNTPVPAPTENPNLIKEGTHLVGTNIQPGIYTGQAGQGVFGSCYWQRLKDVSGSFEAIIANDNSVGKFYIEVKSDDFALETGCDLTYLPTLPPPASEFPTNIEPGTYLVGIDILPGMYQGQAGTEVLDSCYWTRLNSVAGEFGSIIANDNASGQYFVQVQQGDFALSTACDLVRVGD